MDKAKHTPSATIGRFAPSPTGRIHAGNIFAALIAWLVVRRNRGRIILRIEDIDEDRSRPEYAELIQRDFEMLGLEWDEGPFFQSKRKEYYAEAFHTLASLGYTYPCYCTRADIAAASAPHDGDIRIYPGTCRSLTRLERIQLDQGGKKPSIRFAVENTVCSFKDQFQGECHFNLANDCGDFIIRRSDSSWAYQLAVVVDDAEMGISSVVRGADLLQSTPQQIALQNALSYSTPTYGHIPVLITSTGRRIAKREHDASLESLLQRYKTPEAILGHLAYLAGIVEYNRAYSAQELLICAQLDALKGKRHILWHE